MKKKMVLVITCLVNLCILGACSSTKANSATKSHPKTEVVAIGNAWKPFEYTNKNGKESGYEYYVLKAIDKKLPDYKFKYDPMDFTSVLVALDSGKADIAAHTFTLNNARKKKYDYTRQVYYQNVVRLIISKRNNSVHSLKDLAGKPVLATTGEATAQAIEAWNKKHPNEAVKLKYANYTIEQTVAAIDNGTLAAWYSNDSVLKELNQQYGNKLKFADGKPVLKTNSIFFLNKKDKKLRKEMDKAIKELRDDGTLTKLSKKYVGSDVSGSNEH